MPRVIQETDGGDEQPSGGEGNIVADLSPSNMKRARPSLLENIPSMVWRSAVMETNNGI
jgi:hypothetical protein